MILLLYPLIQRGYIYCLHKDPQEGSSPSHRLRGHQKSLPMRAHTILPASQLTELSRSGASEGAMFCFSTARYHHLRNRYGCPATSNSVLQLQHQSEVVVALHPHLLLAPKQAILHTSCFIWHKRTTSASHDRQTKLPLCIHNI